MPDPDERQALNKVNDKFPRIFGIINNWYYVPFSVPFVSLFRFIAKFIVFL